MLTVFPERVAATISLRMLWVLAILVFLQHIEYLGLPALIQLLRHLSFVLSLACHDVLCELEG
jgi:hypothetical protein